MSDPQGQLALLREDIGYLKGKVELLTNQLREEQRHVRALRRRVAELEAAHGVSHDEDD